MLFQYYKPSFVLEQLRELSLPRSEYTSELTELSPPESFITEDEIDSLRRFKDDVKSVKQGYECGIGIEKFQDLKVGDTIEGYQVKEVERTE